MQGQPPQKADEQAERLSDGQQEGSNVPSYYDEGSEYDEEEYESEEDDISGS